MENITEWAGRIEKNVRNKPNKQLQKELFNRVINALRGNTNTYEECVAAFCRFDPKVIPPFYQDYYGQMYRIVLSGMMQFLAGRIPKSPQYLQQSEWHLFFKKN